MTTLISREEPDDVKDMLDDLHVVASPELDRVVDPGALDGEPIVLVAWQGDVPVGYLVASSPEVGAVELWEHGVHPDHRHRGVGRALLHELAKSCDPGTCLRLDPSGQLDHERAFDYYSACGFRRVDIGGHLWATAAAVRQATSI
jgi:ribosomal protein S18 acetylase RimI-like enzyme